MLFQWLLLAGLGLMVQADKGEPTWTISNLSQEW